MHIDPYILTFSALTVIATIWMGFWSARKSKTTSDFFVAGRSVSVGWNASAISGEYLSAASFMGVAGMVMSSGYDALWYPVCYACGYLFLLLFIAGPLRRFGAYTIPDFAEGRFDSPVFRKIAVIFVLFIGFFYTMPQMKGAGTTLAYIFPGLPYWAGVVLVGAVITLNVALGGMKGITLVQAFQYWLKMFAISVPIFVLMAVYGHYGKHLHINGRPASVNTLWKDFVLMPVPADDAKPSTIASLRSAMAAGEMAGIDAFAAVAIYSRKPVLIANALTNAGMLRAEFPGIAPEQNLAFLESELGKKGVALIKADEFTIAVPQDRVSQMQQVLSVYGASAFKNEREPLPPKAPLDETWLNPFGPLTTKAAKNAAAAIGKRAATGTDDHLAASMSGSPLLAENGNAERDFKKRLSVRDAVYEYASLTKRKPLHSGMPSLDRLDRMLNGRLTVYGLIRSPPLPTNIIEFASPAPVVRTPTEEAVSGIYNVGMSLKPAPRLGIGPSYVIMRDSRRFVTNLPPETAAKVFDETRVRTTCSARVFDLWAALNRLDVELIPVGEEYLAARVRDGKKMSREGSIRFSSSPPSQSSRDSIPLRADLAAEQRMTVNLDSPTVAQALAIYVELTGRQLLPNTNSLTARVDGLLGGKLSALKLVARTPAPDSGVREHADGAFTAVEVKAAIENQLRANGLALIAVGDKGFRVAAADARQPAASEYGTNQAGPTSAATEAEKAWLAKHEKPLALLYTYSLIIALVCGTAGLPHILVRFYTNPDGVAAKRTTMWVMILIGVFYLFPPIFGVMGRNLLPSLYAGTGAKGTDKVVLELPRVVGTSEGEKAGAASVSATATTETRVRKSIPWGSILSGITCAGAFAAFMSTFSGLLVSMTGALAHDVYGRILRPKATPEQRLRMFKISAVLIGGVAILLGSFVEPLQINFMVGQAFAIAAASYFPLLFMSVWWRGMTMKGAAAGMLTGGICALASVTITNFSDLKWINLSDFWAANPLLRILCEQPAIWTVPLAIGLMVIVSKMTKREVPSDSRMKMLVLHAPEQLGLKQEYIQEHQPH